MFLLSYFILRPLIPRSRLNSSSSSLSHCVISNHWLFLVTICILPLLIPPCNGDLEPLGVLDIWLFMNFSVVISVDDRTHEKQLKLPKHVKPKTIYYIYQEYASGWNKFCTYMKNLHDLRFFFLNVTNHTYISVHLQS